MRRNFGKEGKKNIGGKLSGGTNDKTVKAENGEPGYRGRKRGKETRTRTDKREAARQDFEKREKENIGGRLSGGTNDKTMRAGNEEPNNRKYFNQWQHQYGHQ
ncbi:MAG: hypothetical protein Q4F50_07820 [Bacteroides sp.]|uniref:hypothetical protein n=1 Tax=Bacteroides sp. TaxID=29523 RepID=UPI0026DEBEA7|nr:hypothetical protein [Bacteroides sp.]MDO5419954.1 hypothetical protein [Bacteroides sp.]